MIAAIYARKSTAQAGVADEAKSVARQIEHATEYAVGKGWTVNTKHIYVDDGISGAEFAHRPGFVRLMTALKPTPPFQVLIMSEESRLGRESIAVSFALKQLVTANVRVFCYLTDTERTLDSPIEKGMLALQTMADEMERVKARQRTYDAMVRKAKAGHVTGGVVFGYENHRTEAGHVVRMIKADEAVVVREIFKLYASGCGVRGIAKRLNDLGVLCPRPQQRRPAGWAPSSVWSVLKRPLYHGEIVWGQTKKRNRWGEKARSDRDVKEWVRVPAPTLRIVPEALWEAVQRRRADARRSYLSSTKGETFGRPPNGFESKYLLTGLVRCGRCGGSLVVRSRSHRHQRAYFYACSSFHRRGRSVCTNSLDAPLMSTDDAILSEIEEYVLHPDVVERAIILALDELRPPAEVVESERHRLLTDLRTLERELEQLTGALAAGGDLPSLLDGMRAREGRRASVGERLRHLDRTRDFTTRSATRLERDLRLKLGDWRRLLRGAVREARQILRALIQDRIDFTPEVQGTRRLYRYEGTFSVGPLFDGVIDPQALASPRGTANGWKRVFQGFSRAA